MLRFIDQIHQAFHEAVRSGALMGLEEFPSLLRDLGLPAEERDRLWSTALTGYQRGPRGPWAALLLEAMSPDLSATVVGLPRLPATIRHEEVGQQMIIELLQAAEKGPTDPARWSPNRLLSVMTRRTYRWLAREVRSLSQSTAVVERPAPTIGELPELVIDLERRARQSTGMAILYREAILGEPLGLIAQDLRLPQNAARHRRRRAVVHLRRELAA